MQGRLSMSHLQVIAKAYDNPIPGYGTATVGNLRLWESLPVNELNLGLFNEGKFNEVCARAQENTGSQPCHGLCAFGPCSAGVEAA